MIVYLAKFSLVYFPITVKGIDSRREAEKNEIGVEVDRQAQSHLFLDHLFKYFHLVNLFGLPLYPQFAKSLRQFSAVEGFFTLLVV